MIGPAAETAKATQPMATRTTAACAGLQPDAEPAGGVVAELEDARATRLAASASGRSTASATASGHGVLPGAGVQRPGDPDVGRRGVVDLGVGEQPVDERGADRPERDADEHQPVAVDPGPPGEQEQQAPISRAPSSAANGTPSAGDARRPSSSTIGGDGADRGAHR